MGSEPEPRPAKCVKISADEPVVIPNPRSVCRGGYTPCPKVDTHKHPDLSKLRKYRQGRVSADNYTRGQTLQETCVWLLRHLLLTAKFPKNQTTLKVFLLREKTSSVCKKQKKKLLGGEILRILTEGFKGNSDTEWLFDFALSSPVTDCKEKVTEENQQQNKREERRKKQRTVEMMHVSSHSSMENECAQQ